MTEQSIPKCFSVAPVQLWSARPSGELSYVNETVVSYFGRNSAAIIEWGWAELVHADDLAAVGDKWSMSLETGAPYEIEFRLLRHDGAYFWHLGRAEAIVDPGGAVSEWVGANMLVDALVQRGGHRR